MELVSLLYTISSLLWMNFLPCHSFSFVAFSIHAILLSIGNCIWEHRIRICRCQVTYHAVWFIFQKGCWWLWLQDDWCHQFSFGSEEPAAAIRCAVSVCPANRLTSSAGLLCLRRMLIVDDRLFVNRHSIGAGKVTNGTAATAFLLSTWRCLSITHNCPGWVKPYDH